MKKFPFLCKAAETGNWPWPAPSCINTPSTPSFRASDEIVDQFPDKNEENAVIQGLMSDRLFFEPGKTNSILEEAKLKVSDGGVAVVEMDSRDPVGDFKASMAEMVEAYGLREDWGCLEELLEWYLQVNGEHNHAYIIGAFVDLVLHLESGNNDDDRVMMNEERAASSASSSNALCSFTFSSSNYSSTTTTHCLSVLETDDDDDDDDDRLHHGIHVILN